MTVSPPSALPLVATVNGLRTTQCLFHGVNRVLTFSTQMDGTEAERSENLHDSIRAAEPGCHGNPLQPYGIQAQLLL